jgi:hypothetical protein
MNKFTLVVEKDETQLTPEQEIFNFWNEYKEKNKDKQNITYEFYHDLRSKGYEGYVILDVLDKNK